MAVAFIVLANPRSGSTFVADMLGSHPAAKVYGELLLPHPARERPLWEPNDLEFAKVFVNRQARGHPGLARPYWTFRYLQRVFDQPGVQVVGMKLMYEQVHRWPETLPFLMARRVRVIHLVRRNLLDIVLSDKVREQRGVWHVRSDGRPPLPGDGREPADSKLHLDPDVLVRSLNHLAHNRRMFRAWLKLTHTPAVEVSYEELVAERSRFAPLLSFLGLEADDWTLLKTGLEKMNTRPHAELIDNFAAVEAKLSRTAFADFVRQ